MDLKFFIIDSKKKKYLDFSLLQKILPDLKWLQAHRLLETGGKSAFYLERAVFKEFYTHYVITSLLAHPRWTQLELDELSQSAVRDAIQHPPATDQKLSEQKQVSVTAWELLQ